MRLSAVLGREPHSSLSPSVQGVEVLTVLPEEHMQCLGTLVVVTTKGGIYWVGARGAAKLPTGHRTAHDKELPNP